MSVTVQIGLCGLWLAVVFVVSEGLRRQRIHPEVVRKCIHIGVGNIILLAWYLAVPRWLGVGFGCLFSLVALLSYRLPLLPSLNGVDRHSFGAFFYAISITVLLALFWQAPMHIYAVIGILVMTWGDALAALVGQAWGKHRYSFGSIKKSWEGSLAMWLMSTIAIGAVLWFGLDLGVVTVSGGMIVSIAIGVAAVVTVLEVFSWGGLDNLTVPLAASGLCYWLLSLT